MAGRRTEHGLWPDSRTELLLRAGLESGARAEAAFRAWLDAIPEEARGAPALLPSAERRLLPLVEGNLAAGGMSHPWLVSSGGAIRRAAAERNQGLFRAAAEAVSLLARAGVDAIVLKGVVLALERYQDPSLRPMSDVDLLVRPGDLERALRVLGQAGFVERPAHPRLRPYLCAFELTRERDGVEIDLHQYLIEHGSSPGAERALMARARSFEMLAPEARAPSDADLLLHICAASLKFGRHTNSRWVVDAARLLTNRYAPLDWSALVLAVRERRMVAPVRECLTYLADSFALPVPREVLEALHRERPSGAEWRTYRALTARPRTLAAVIEQHRVLYAFGTRASGRARTPLGFLEFAARHLLYQWRLESPWRIPAEACARLARLLRPRGGPHLPTRARRSSTSLRRRESPSASG